VMGYSSLGWMFNFDDWDLEVAIGGRLGSKAVVIATRS